MITFDDAFLAELKHISFVLGSMMADGMQGGKKSKLKGNSLEFSDFREYIPGDDFRRIDWTAYGRLDKLFIKVFMEEKEAVFRIFVDTSRSMNVGTLKSETTLKLTAALSYIVLDKMDRAYVYSLEGKTANPYLKSITNKNSFYQLLDRMGQTQFNHNDDIVKSLVSSPINTKGMSIWISDFLLEGGSARIEEALRYLGYKKQQIVMIQVMSPEELNPDMLGDYEIKDSETGGCLNITVTPKMREKYKKRLKDYNTEISRLANKYGAKYILVDSTKSLEEIIFKQLLTAGVVN